MRYPIKYYNYHKIAGVNYYLDKIGGLFNRKELLRLSKGNQYPLDFIKGIQDACEFLHIDLKRFLEYYSTHSEWPNKLWEECSKNPDKFNDNIFGEYGRANICANCICSFSLKYSYDTVYLFLNKLNEKRQVIKVCDYGCCNANISFAMLMLNKISYLVMTDLYNESAKFIDFRIDKYDVKEKAVWQDVRTIKYENEFDVIICFDVLEHTPNPSEILETKIYPMLKKGGLLIVQAPWGGDVVSHLDEAVYDFYQNGGRIFLRKAFKKIYSMTPLDISGVWVKR